MDKDTLIYIRDSIKDGIIDFDDRVQNIMFNNSYMGSETDRALFAIVTLPIFPVVLVYETVRGGVILTSKAVNKIGETIENKKDEKTLLKKK